MNLVVANEIYIKSILRKLHSDSKALTRLQIVSMINNFVCFNFEFQNSTLSKMRNFLSKETANSGTCTIQSLNLSHKSPVDRLEILKLPTFGFKIWLSKYGHRCHSSLLLVDNLIRSGVDSLGLFEGNFLMDQHQKFTIIQFRGSFSLPPDL